MFALIPVPTWVAKTVNSIQKQKMKAVRTCFSTTFVHRTQFSGSPTRAYKRLLKVSQPLFIIEGLTSDAA